MILALRMSSLCLSTRLPYPVIFLQSVSQLGKGISGKCYRAYQMSLDKEDRFCDNYPQATQTDQGLIQQQTMQGSEL